MDEKTKAIVEQTEGVLTEVYKDLVSPSVQPIGIMLSYLPRTIRLGLSRWEKWLINGEESLKLTAQALKDKNRKNPRRQAMRTGTIYSCTGNSTDILLL